MHGFGARFDWVLPGKLAVGAAPSREEDIAELNRMGVTAVLTLQEQVYEEIQPHPVIQNGDFKWGRMPIKDSFSGGVPTPDQLGKAVWRLHHWLESGEVVLVHCNLGNGRAPLVCMAYLVVHRSLRMTEAIAQVKRARRSANPNVEQLMAMGRYLKEQRINR